VIRFFTSIGGFLLGALLFAFLLTISFNPNFFAKVMLKDFAKSIAQPATNSLDKFLDESVLEPILDSPQTLTSLGLHQLDFLTNHNENLDDYSVEKSELDHEKFLVYYEKLNNFDETQLPNSAKLNLEVAKFAANIEKRGFENFRYYMGPFIQFYGTHLSFVNFMTDTHKLVSEKDAEDYIKRISKIPDAIEQLMVFEKRRAEAGIYSPKFVYEKTLLQLTSLIETPTDQHPLFITFRDASESMDLENDKRENMLLSLKDNIEKFKSSYAKLKILVEENSNNAREFDGVWSLPNGDDYYKHRLQIFTTTDLTADEIHNLGLQMVEEIQSEIKRILSDEGYDVNRPLADLFVELNNDPRFLFEDSDKGREAILEEYRRINDETYAMLPDYFNELPKAKVVVKRVPIFSEKSAAGGYYQGSSLDGSRPAAWYANLYDINATQTFKMPALSFHEAVPGHHLQIALNQENQNQTLWNKFGYRTSAFSEGWALYAERLAVEAGLIKDPYEMIGSLQSELFRAARLVVDTGLHSKKWTREEAIIYMMDNAGEVRSESESEIERYIVWPGQATSYMIGRIKIMELRERAKTELGNRFDIKDFHSVVLMNGILPLTVLEALVDQYIKENS
jgi:uncharacterized protein (DUF885 family)|tara:strand:- start:1113 stop:2978 length:1866 start_codon:yes stop_codon:yes gene_type:complete